MVLVHSWNLLRGIFLFRLLKGWL
uniref:Uncharacterized protein n=1 Tax=Musa acuminata subsp. malaccensis TaxID=214687 RepID=A0A804JWM3_MUSAM